jgi:hypothetical protein
MIQTRPRQKSCGKIWQKTALPTGLPSSLHDISPNLSLAVATAPRTVCGRRGHFAVKNPESKPFDGFLFLGTIHATVTAATQRRPPSFVRIHRVIP